MKKQELLLGSDVVNGFSYSFLKIILNEFATEKMKMEVFEFHPDSNFKRLSPLAKNLINYLKQQVPYAGWSEIEITAEYTDYKNSPRDRESINKIFVNLAEKLSMAEHETNKFLNIFE